MKKKIIYIFLALTVVTFVATYPYSYLLLKVGFRLSAHTLDLIMLPTKRIKVSNNNGFIIEQKICIPYKSLFGYYVIDVDLKDKSIELFETKQYLLNEFDIYVSIYNNNNELLFYDTPLTIQEKSRDRYNSVVLNEYTLPKAGCYKFNIRGISKNKYESKYKDLYFTLSIADRNP
ncbi:MULTISPECIES: hypothetical protein [Glaesserella]|uniref:Uncharacterized protein n=1 Tax=Glaesserella australis TaxID=2094024 RepID=A0A328C1T8_9PAST|nr:MULTISPECIES: hypothetical protein [Glaesserella]AUI66240.1 hypothetical protein CJD39_06430 [Glaesserella sp. 15-184]RAL19262.1 hypothetical protein C5N92_03855 [Glaesserella australis]